MNLTKEYFDKALKNLATKGDLKNFATKADLKKLVTKDELRTLEIQIDDRFEKQTQILMAYTDDKIEMLARMVNSGFEDMKERLDVNERVVKIERDLKKIKQVLHV
jgi:hypothetical protein